MPLVKIELKKGQTKEFLSSLILCTTEAIIEVLRIPDNDRNIRIIEYEPHLFIMKPPYEILIEIILFSGRTDRTKTDLYKKNIEKLDARLSIKGETVFIIINEQPKVNWGVRGGKPASDIKFDFDIEI